MVVCKCVVYLYQQNETIMYTKEQIKEQATILNFNEKQTDELTKLINIYECSMIEAIQEVIECQY